MARVIHYLIEDFDFNQLQYTSFELQERGVPEAVLASVPEGSFLDVTNERVIGYLFRVGDTFYGHEDDYVVSELALGYLIAHGTAYFANTLVRNIAIPRDTLVNGQLLTEAAVLDLAPEEPILLNVGGRQCWGEIV